MANSRFEYVKEFESDPALLRDCWAVVRIDGQSFHKYDRQYHCALARPTPMTYHARLCAPC